MKTKDDALVVTFEPNCQIQIKEYVGYDDISYVARLIWRGDLYSERNCETRDEAEEAIHDYLDKMGVGEGDIENLMQYIKSDAACKACLRQKLNTSIKFFLS